MLESLSVCFEDFVKARIKVKPSALREVILEVPKVSWKDVGGQKEVKMQLMEAVEWPQKHQDAFKRTTNQCLIVWSPGVQQNSFGSCGGI